MTLDIPALPEITARFRGDSGELSIDGVRESFAAGSTEELRESILARVSALAGELGRPVRMVTEDDEGQWLLVVQTNGEIGDEERIGTDPAVESVEHPGHAHHSADQPFEPIAIDDVDQTSDIDQTSDDTDDGGDTIDAGTQDDVPVSAWETGGIASLLPFSDEAVDDDDDAVDPIDIAGTTPDAEHRPGFIGPPPVSVRPYEDEDDVFDEFPAGEAPFEPARVTAFDEILGVTRAEPIEQPDDALAALVAQSDPAQSDVAQSDPAQSDVAQSDVAPAEPAPAASALHLPPAATPSTVPHPMTAPNPALHIETEPEPEPSAGRASFLIDERKPDRAATGWRGLLAKAGLPIQASAKERVERQETHLVSQHWAGPRTIAIVNGKGGANKTPTTAMLAAVFARNGGSGVLAWDNNETRGTLGWRTEQGLHEATVQTLLPNTDHLLSPGAQSSDLSHFVHHQTGDKYDVLRSNPTMLATQQRITTDDFDRLHSVAAKYFRLIFIDSGNDESAERWLRMIDHTDQLVIATTALGEHAEAGALLLEALAQRDERSAQLAAQAVVVVSQSEKSGSPADARRVASGFETIARRAVSVPFDPAMHGGRLEYDALSPASRRAWLHAAAAVAEGL